MRDGITVVYRTDFPTSFQFSFNRDLLIVEKDLKRFTKVRKMENFQFSFNRDLL